MTNEIKPSELKRLIRAFFFSKAGLIAAFRCEPAFRTELYVAAVMIPAGAILGDGGVEKAALIGVILVILVVELLNSAIESAMDRIGPEHHKLAGQAKDMGSAAVLVALINAAVVWALVLFL